MTVLSTFAQNIAEPSIMHSCCGALLCQNVRETLMEIWPGIDEIRIHSLYLNSDDLRYPPAKVMKRKDKIYITLTLYENQLGARRPDTRDFDQSAVCEVVCDLYEKGLHIAAQRIGDTGMTLEQRQAVISEAIRAFAETFDPTRSVLFEEQPPLRKEKFYLDPNK